MQMGPAGMVGMRPQAVAPMSGMGMPQSTYRGMTVGQNVQSQQHQQPSNQNPQSDPFGAF